MKKILQETCTSFRAEIWWLSREKTLKISVKLTDRDSVVMSEILCGVTSQFWAMSNTYRSHYTIFIKGMYRSITW